MSHDAVSKATLKNVHDSTNWILASVVYSKAGGYLDFRSGWVVEGHVVKLNISFDPVELISSLRETINLGLLTVTHLKMETCQREAMASCHAPLKDQNYNIKCPHSVNSLKDNGCSPTTSCERLQARGGLPQIHGCYQNTEEDLQWRDSDLFLLWF